MPGEAADRGVPRCGRCRVGGGGRRRAGRVMSGGAGARVVGTWRPSGQEMLLVCGGGASSAHSGPHLVRAGPVGAALVPEAWVEWSEIVRRMRRKDGSEPLDGLVLVCGRAGVAAVEWAEGARRVGGSSTFCPLAPGVGRAGRARGAGPCGNCRRAERCSRLRARSRAWPWLLPRVRRGGSSHEAERMARVDPTSGVVGRLRLRWSAPGSGGAGRLDSEGPVELAVAFGARGTERPTERFA